MNAFNKSVNIASFHSLDHFGSFPSLIVFYDG